MSFRQIFRDADGNIVIAQFPNFPLIAWVVLKIISYLPISTDISSGAQLTATGFLLVWAYLEFTQGVNLFRKSIGLIVIVAIIVGNFF